jgi:CRP-like cAMP-binding protein
MTDVTSTTLAALRAIPYLAGVPEADVMTVARQSTLRRARRGDTIFEEGEAAAGVFVVLEGRVKLVRASAAGREQILHAEGPGATLAEVPAFDGGGYVASAVAEDDARLLFVPRSALLDLCRRRPDVALGVIRVLAGRLRRFAGLIEDLALRDVTARVARLLLEVAARDGSVVLPGTRDDVASRLGTVRELVSRSLARLIAAGAIERRGRRLRVRDAARLRAAADGRAASAQRST